MVATSSKPRPSSGLRACAPHPLPNGLALRPIAPVDVPRDYDRGEDSPADLFVERVADYKATVRRCAPDGIAEAVAALLDGVPGIVVPPGVPGDWLASYPGRIVRDDGLTVADVAGRLCYARLGCFRASRLRRRIR